MPVRFVRSILPPPCILIAICWAALGHSAMAQGVGTTFQGPNPWVDISNAAYGGVDDALINNTATQVNKTTLSIGTASAPKFAAALEGGKAIAFTLAAGNTGIMNTPVLTLTTGCDSANGKLKDGAAYFVQITWVAEHTTGTSYFLGESKATAFATQTISCSGVNDGTLNVSSSTPSNALITSFSVYASQISGQETQQTLSTAMSGAAYCQSATLATTYPNACIFGSAHAVTLNNIVSNGPFPPAATSWQTTVSGTSNTTTQVTLTDATPVQITGTNNVVVWGTDNTAPFASALNACTRSAVTNATTTGCAIHFTYPSPTSGTHTGRFYMSQTALISGAGSTPSNNVVLMGSGGLGNAGIGGGSFTLTRPTPEIVVGSRLWAVQVGDAPTDTSANVAGFAIYGLGIEDALGNAFGAISLFGEVDGTYLDRVSMINFASGECLHVDGGNGLAQVQIATIHKIRGDGCKFGIRAPGNFSDFEIDGGTLTSSDISTTGIGIGLDFERNPTAMAADGNIRIHDIALRDFPAGHIKLVDIAAATIVQIKEENINTGVQGFGIDLETNPLANSNKCSGTRIAFPVIASVAVGINIGAGCSNIDIYKPTLSSTNPSASVLLTDNGTNTSSITDEYGVTLGMGTPPLGIAGRSVNIVVPNETSTGTTLYETAILTGVGSSCPGGTCAMVPSTATTPPGIVGIVVSTPAVGTTGNAVIAVSGIAPCVFDSQATVTVGHFAIVSTATAGRCRDSSSKSGEVLGIVMDSATVGNKTLRVALTVSQ